MPCRGGSSAPAANHQKSNTSTIDDHIVDYATEDEALTNSTTELYHYQQQQQSSNLSTTANSNSKNGSNISNNQLESLTEETQALNPEQLHQSQSGQQLKLPHIEEEEDDEFDIGMQHFHNPLLPSRIKACTIRYADVVRSLTPSPKISINRIKIKSKAKSLASANSSSSSANAAAVALAAAATAAASDLESSSSSTNISSSTSKMQAEQGSIGDLQKYHSRYLKNRRHTLANVR